MSGRPSNRLSLRRYMALFVGALVVVAIGAGVFVRIQAEQNARDSAGADAAFAAQHAAKQVGAGFDVVDAATAPPLTGPGAEHLFANGSTCQVAFAPVGAFDTGHIDIVKSDGSIVCSSLKSSLGTKAVYAVEGEVAAKGLTMVWASDGETAEDLWRDGKAKAIVMDLRLPGVQGEDLLARLRANHGPHVPVVVVSVKSLEAAETMGLQKSGVTAILRKGAGTTKEAAELVAQGLVAQAVA